MNIHTAVASGLMTAFLISSTVLAQDAAPTGHWEGTLQARGQELKVEVDLARPNGTWQGRFSVPAQNLTNFPLSDISIDGDTVAFALKGLPGAPAFTGTLTNEGKSLSGDFSQGGGSTPLVLARMGDPKIEPLPPSTPIAPELVGAWEGALDAGGQILHLVLNLSNAADGTAAATLVSIEQGGIELPATAVTQTGSHLTVLVQVVAGRFEGDLKDGQLVGTWTQGPVNLPLTFKRRP